MPVLAKSKTITGRLWTYVRDDQPFGGPAPPAALFYYSRDRGGEHPRRHLADYAGILQADAYAGFNDLYERGRRPGPIAEAACLAHGRRKFYVLADVVKAPIAVEAVRRIDAPFDIEREINGLSPEQRLAARAQDSAPLVAELEVWLRTERARLSRHNDISRAIDYILKRWPAFTRFLEDGRICLSNNAAERALRGVALGRRAWMFAGSDRGGERAARCLQPHRHGQAEQRRSPRLAGRRPTQDWGSPGQSPRRPASLELAQARERRDRRRSLTIRGARRMPLDPMGVYFGTSTGSLFASADGGDSWRCIAEHLPPISSVETVVLEGMT